MAGETGGHQTVFGKKSILEKQTKQREEYEQKIQEMRKAFEEVASTPSGMKMFQYVFLLSGGDMGSVRRDKEGEISMDDTLLTLGAKSVWENIRFNLSSDVVKKVERHNWEQ